MHDVLRERINRHLEALPEERLYQVLDYIEFLSSKYARDVRPPGSPLQRFGERLEDRLRFNGVGFGAIRGTLGMMGTADRFMSGITEAGRSIIREVENGLKSGPDPGMRPESSTSPEVLPPPRDPGSGAPKLPEGR